MNKYIINLINSWGKIRLSLYFHNGKLVYLGLFHKRSICFFFTYILFIIFLFILIVWSKSFSSASLVFIIFFFLLFFSIGIFEISHSFTALWRISIFSFSSGLGLVSYRCFFLSNVFLQFLYRFSVVISNLIFVIL